MDEATALRHSLAAGNIERIADAARAGRRARGEVMTYELEGWIVRELADGRIVRLARAGEFRSDEHPIAKPGEVQDAPGDAL